MKFKIGAQTINEIKIPPKKERGFLIYTHKQKLTSKIEPQLAKVPPNLRNFVFGEKNMNCSMHGGSDIECLFFRFRSYFVQNQNHFSFTYLQCSLTCSFSSLSTISPDHYWNAMKRKINSSLNSNCQVTAEQQLNTLWTTSGFSCSKLRRLSVDN